MSAGAANISLLATSPGVFDALRNVWNVAVTRTMILSTALVAASFPFTIGMEWLNTKKVASQKKHLREQ